MYRDTQSSSHAKFQIHISIFDPQMTVISVKCGDVIKINHIFGAFIDIVHKKPITPLDSWDETESEKCALFSKILNFENWPFLTFFDLTLRSNLKITATIGF